MRTSPACQPEPPQALPHITTAVAHPKPAGTRTPAYKFRRAPISRSNAHAGTKRVRVPRENTPVTLRDLPSDDELVDLTTPPYRPPNAERPTEPASSALSSLKSTATQLELLQRAAARAQQHRHASDRPASPADAPKRATPHAKPAHSSRSSKATTPLQDFCASDSSDTSFGSCASGTTWPPETRRAPVARLQQLQHQQQQQQRPFSLPSLNSITTSQVQFPAQPSETPDKGAGSSNSALNSLAGLSGMIVDSNMAYYPLPAWQPALPLPGMRRPQYSQQRHWAAGGSPPNSGESADMSTSSRQHLPGSPCSWPGHQPVLSPNPLGFAGGFNVPGFPGFVPQ